MKEKFDQLLKEIEERTPLLKQQREQYEESVSNVIKLTEQLNSAMEFEKESKLKVFRNFEPYPNYNS